MAVAEGVIEAQDERGQLDLSCRVGDEVIHRVPGLLARRVRQRDEFQHLPGDRADTPSRNFVIGKRLPEPEVGVRYLFAVLGNGRPRFYSSRLLDRYLGR